MIPLLKINHSLNGRTFPWMTQSVSFMTFSSHSFDFLDDLKEWNWIMRTETEELWDWGFLNIDLHASICLIVSLDFFLYSFFPNFLDASLSVGLSALHGWVTWVWSGVEWKKQTRGHIQKIHTSVTASSSCARWCVGLFSKIFILLKLIQLLK